MSEASTAREIGAPGMGCTRMGNVERMSRAQQKALSRGRVQSNIARALEGVGEGGPGLKLHS